MVRFALISRVHRDVLVQIQWTERRSGVSMIFAFSHMLSKPVWKKKKKSLLMWCKNSGRHPVRIAIWGDGRRSLNPVMRALLGLAWTQCKVENSTSAFRLRHRTNTSTTSILLQAVVFLSWTFSAESHFGTPKCENTPSRISSKACHFWAENNASECPRRAKVRETCLKINVLKKNGSQMCLISIDF